MITAALLATTPWWATLKHAGPVQSPRYAISKGHLLFSIGLICILLAALLMRLPRMEHSLWGDEEWARWAGLPLQGPLVAAALTVHPWHLRYSTEARGYSLTQLALMGLIFSAALAGRDTRWRWSITGVLCSGAMALAWPGSLIYLVIIHAVILIALGLNLRSSIRCITR